MNADTPTPRGEPFHLSDIQATPSTCPVCGAPMPPRTILVCWACWQKVPGKDRAQFRAMFSAHRDRVECWQSKAAKIIRQLKAARA